MFDWLVRDLRCIQTAKFHLVSGTEDRHLRQLIESVNINYPNDYRQFVIDFGSGRFFRQSLFGYKLGVLSTPRVFCDSDELFQIGYDDGSPVCFSTQSEGLYLKGLASPIAPNFDSWLKSSYEKYRAQYSDKDWLSILKGPQTFSALEDSIVNARNDYHWLDLGIDESGDRIIQVTNHSSIFIPCLSLGVRSSDERLNGAIIIDVSGLCPGDTEIYPHTCYKKFYPPSDISLYDLPAPGPEDRQYLAELKRAHDGARKRG